MKSSVVKQNFMQVDLQHFYIFKDGRNGFPLNHISKILIRFSHISANGYNIIMYCAEFTGDLQ